MSKTKTKHDEALEFVMSVTQQTGSSNKGLLAWGPYIHLRLCESIELAENQAVATARTNELLEQLVERRVQMEAE